MSIKTKNALVLVEDYPNNEGGISLMYVHTRNLYYIENNIDVTVLNFSASQDYNYEGIKVISMSSYKASRESYSLLIVHAANIRHHYIFLKKYQKLFERIIFFYHGHEVLRINSVYSKPYSYIKNNYIKNAAQDCYDTFKLLIWRQYLPKIKDKSYFVFVSRWMQDEFFKWTQISKKLIIDNCFITYNCVGKNFEMDKYDCDCEKEYDFVTIRSYLDGSKYSVDLVNEWAKNTPSGRFLVIGKGDFFKFNNKANNLQWINTTLSHEDIERILNKSKFALMPTRTDAQGLMMCEMAAFGIPVITSDIPVCHEIFDGFSNAYLVDNKKEISLESFVNKKTECVKDVRYFKKITLDNELSLINRSFKIMNS